MNQGWHEIGQSTRATYINVANGKFVRRLKTADEHPDATTRTTAKGNVIHELDMKSPVGFITGLEFRDNEFNGIINRQLMVTLDVNSEKYIITMPSNSSYAKRLINSAASITDFGVTVRLYAWQMENPEKAGKYWQGISLYTPPHDKDSKVLPKYSKEEIPDMKKVRVKGNDVWDDEDQMKFYENVVTTEIMPRIQAARGAQSFAAIGIENEAHLIAPDDDTDDDGSLLF